ncbi:MAG: TenA family protein [Candidatus Neomarinimicrobiota bacterium]
MLFSAKLWKRSRSLFQEMLRHPFNSELAEGTLDLEKFKVYLQQDALYIKSYTKALFNLRAKAPNHEAKAILTSFAEEGYTLEKELHDTFFNTSQVEPIKEALPACKDYGDFLENVTSLSSYPVGLASLLPCFWIYSEVGLNLNNISVQNNPYQPWLDTYTGPEFAEQVRQILELVEDAAANSNALVQVDMKSMYLQSCKMELKFWDACYHA